MAGSVRKPRNDKGSARSQIANRWSNVDYNKLSNDVMTISENPQETDHEVITIDSESETSISDNGNDTDDGISRPVIDARLHDKKYCFKLIHSETVYDKSDTYESMTSEQQDYFITMKDIFYDPNLRQVVLFSYQFEMDFLLKCFHPDIEKVIIIGQPECIRPLNEDTSSARLKELEKKISYIPIKMAPYTSHHTKMILNFYQDSLRIFLPSNNFTEAEVSYPQQVCWCSPKFMFSTNPKWVNGYSKFGSILKDYLSHYNQYQSFFQKLIEKLEKYEFLYFDENNKMEDDIKFIYSVPAKGNYNCGFKKLIDSVKVTEEKYFYKKNGKEEIHYLFQTSSIGTTMVGNDSLLLGLMPDNSSMERIHLNILYPTLKEICDSPASVLSGGWFHFNYYSKSEPYNTLRAKKTFVKQDPLQVSKQRLSTPSHSKFYMKWTSKDTTMNNEGSIPEGGVDWCVYTSANLSKAAWGLNGVKPKNYEFGVFFGCSVQVSSFIDLIYKNKNGSGTRLGTATEQANIATRDKHADRIKANQILIPFPRSYVQYSPDDRPSDVKLLDRISNMALAMNG